MPDPTPRTSLESEEINRQGIFQEINTELIAGRHLTAPRQKTLPNYTHVVLLNIALIILAGSGIYVVYRIFREQGIRLTVGTGSIQSLELLLTEQEARRKTDELRQKENDLRAAQRETAQITAELQDIRLNIDNQVNLELARKRNELTAAIQRELQGKNEAEKAVIQERYDREIARFQEEARVETERLVAEATRQQQERLQKQQEDSARIQEEIRIIGQIQTIPPPVQDAPAYAPIYTDNGASALFNTVDRQLRAGNFPEAERIISNIETLYQRDTTSPPERRSADLFMASLIRNYIRLSNNSIRLSNSNQDSSMADFRKMIAEISKLAAQNPQNPAVAQKIRTLQTESPDVFVFFDSYRKYLSARDSTRAAPSIAQANRAYAAKKYGDAAEQYRDILISYPGIPEQENILKNYSDSIYKISEKGVPYSAEKSVIYMKAPDAYILDISEGKAVLSLMPGIILKPNMRLDVFRLNVESSLQLISIEEALVTEAKGSYALATLSKTKALIGDLVYLKK